MAHTRAYNGEYVTSLCVCVNVWPMNARRYFYLFKKTAYLLIPSSLHIAFNVSTAKIICLIRALPSICPLASFAPYLAAIIIIIIKSDKQTDADEEDDENAQYRWQLNVPKNETLTLSPASPATIIIDVVEDNGKPKSK